MTQTTIHYLWIGTPTKVDPMAIAGHDIAAPIKMAKQLKKQNHGEIDPIKFWCLEEHKKSYKKQFKKAGVNIKVCSIEELLRTEINSNDLTEQAKFVQEFIESNNISSKSKIMDKIELKDLFSLFLLISQGGYFFDTNVFPEKNKLVSLPGEPTVTTAKSGFQQSNDFYMMYSPVRGFPRMLNIFDAWKTQPGFGNVSVFKDHADPVPYFKNDMGVKKLSYKSYFSNKNHGLFYWQARAHDGNDPDLFEEHLPYGDIHKQVTYSQSMKPLEECSVCYLKGPVTDERLLSMPFTTNTAYVQAENNMMYYVNKNTKTTVLVYQGSSTIFDRFPRPYHTEQIKLAKPEAVHAIINALEKPITGHPRLITDVKEYHPPYIINTEDCTLLHQAVLLNESAQVTALLKAGAPVDLKATYEIKPEGTVLKLNPLELAKFLKYGEIISLLSNDENEKVDEVILEASVENIKENKQHTTPLFRESPITKIERLQSTNEHPKDDVKVSGTPKRRFFSFFKRSEVTELPEIVSNPPYLD